MSQIVAKDTCIGFVRSAQNAQGGVEAQLILIQRFAAQRSMEYLGHVDASKSEQRPGEAVAAAVQALIRRKKSSNDFNAVLVTDLSRFGRSLNAAMHGIKALRDAGISVIVAANPEDTTFP